MGKNKETTTNELRTRTTFHVSLTKNSFFGSRVASFTSDSSRLKYWLLRPFFYKEAICKGSTLKGLLYAAKAVPSKDYFTHLTLTITRKGRWVISPVYRASHPRHFCAVGDVVAQRYDVLCDWLWDACHMAGIHWGSRCKGFHSKEGSHYCLEQSVRKLSWDKRQSTLFTSLEIPWEFHTQAVLHSLARPRSRKKVSVQGFLWEKKVWIVFSPTNVCTRNIQRKAEKGKFTSSEATTRFPRASCFEKPTHSVPETWGRMYNILAWSANGTRNWTRNRIPMQPRKARRN